MYTAAISHCSGESDELNSFMNTAPNSGPPHMLFTCSHARLRCHKFALKACVGVRKKAPVKVSSPCRVENCARRGSGQDRSLNSISGVPAVVCESNPCSDFPLRQRQNKLPSSAMVQGMVLWRPGSRRNADSKGACVTNICLPRILVQIILEHPQLQNLSQLEKANSKAITILSEGP